MKLIISAIFSWMILNNPLAFSQGQLTKDTTFLKNAISHMGDMYSELFTEQLQLYNGIAYKEIQVNRNLDRGNPFFLLDSMGIEQIRFDGVLYSNIRLQYDLLQNQVITTLPNTNLKIALIHDKVQHFTVHGHFFENIREGALPSENFQPGFYEVLYKGKVCVYAKRIKVITESNNNLVIKRNFVDKVDLYVYKDGIYYLIKSKKLLLEVLEEHEEVNNSMKAISGRFSKNKERFVVRAVETYDRL